MISSESHSPAPTRRSVVKTAAWAAPAVLATTASPAFAASPVANQTFVDYGLFVSTQFNGGYVGYAGANDTGVIHPTTPTGYFASNPRPESDINWSDATNSATKPSYFVNGEGSFTPATNAGGSTGAYASTSGWWISTPTTTANVGSGYIPGSSTTLAAGATFVTQVSATIPAGPNALWPLQNATIAGQKWNKAISGTLSSAGDSISTYLVNLKVNGRWNAAAPVITTNPDGSATLTGTITFTTTSPLVITQTGTKYYGQVVIMPATVQISPAYGWTNFSLTSSVQSATLSYTVPAPYIAPTTTQITGLTTTSAIHP
ncbi:amino acid oxidase [Falsarthrobacter nasiphocae]|uniref:Uncharacterized protein n=1 Tax=Falsarthrobacter nasiphocae TaxID=189863 RepID=A0AAE3YGZ2_9MICC|nr:amino acid oxidase [Falsarthrobacter nasiphocae]MDR6891995.1 hypothetical protein [Falsarthrobacter nasiphocae]